MERLCFSIGRAVCYALFVIAGTLCGWWFGAEFIFLNPHFSGNTPWFLIPFSLAMICGGVIGALIGRLVLRRKTTINQNEPVS